MRNVLTASALALMLVACGERAMTQDQRDELLRPKPDPAFARETWAQPELPPLPNPAPRATLRAVTPAPVSPFPKTWTVSWTVPASTRTNHPADFTGLAVRDGFAGPFVTANEVAVNYYTLRDTRTNSFGQTYQTWKLVTNDLRFSATVSTLAAAGQVGAYTR